MASVSVKDNTVPWKTLLPAFAPFWIGGVSEAIARHPPAPRVALAGLTILGRLILGLIFDTVLLLLCWVLPQKLGREK
jgi:hypothetical protein